MITLVLHTLVRGLLIELNLIGVPMNKLNTDKAVGLFTLLIAVLAGLGVTIPFVPLLLIGGGFVYGYYTQDDSNIRVIISALALSAFASALIVVPEIGNYLAAIVGNIAKIALGASILIILRNLYKRLNPVDAPAA